MALREDITETTKTSDITLSERAASELKGLIEENNKENAALRVWVAGGGCSGLQYGMALDDAEPEEGDLVLHDKGVKIFVDGMSMKYMVGAVVDYVDDTLGGGFKIENPNAVKSCGCGSSFSTEEEGMEGLSTGGGGCGSCGSH
jgi:iron-sulfur cluster assembly accessory protein